LNIVKALHQRASVLQDELDKIQQAIRALKGTRTGVRRDGWKWHHTPATKRKLALAQKKLWAAKRKRK
jgi:hypothetical protein